MVNRISTWKLMNIEKVLLLIEKGIDYPKKIADVLGLGYTSFSGHSFQEYIFRGLVELQGGGNRVNNIKRYRLTEKGKRLLELFKMTPVDALDEIDKLGDKSNAPLSTTERKGDDRNGL